VAHRRIGIDIGHTGVRVAEVDAPPGRRPKLLAFGQSGIEPGAVQGCAVRRQEGVVAAVRRALRASGARSRHAVVGVAGEHTYVRPVALPAASPAQMRASLPFLVQDALPVDVADCVLDFWPVRRLDRVVEGLLVAVRSAEAAAVVRAAEKAGVRVDQVDLAAFGLLRAAVPASPDEPVTAVVDLGCDGMQVVVGEAGTPQLVRFGPAAGLAVAHDVAGALGGDPSVAEHVIDADLVARPEVAALVASHAERIAQVIAQTLAYHAQSGRRPAEAVLLTGRGAEMPGLGQCLATVTRLPVAFARPEAVFDVATRAARGCADAPRSWPVAAGLAMRGAA